MERRAKAKRRARRMRRARPREIASWAACCLLGYATGYVLWLIRAAGR